MNRNQQSFELWEQGKKEEAIQLLLEEIEEHPAEADAYINLGSMFMMMEKYEDAATIFATASEKSPENTEVIYCFASLYYEQGQYEAAIKQYEKVIVLKPDQEALADANFMIGMSYQGMGDYNRALVYVMRAAELSPEVTDFNLAAGDILMSLEQFDQAKQYYDLAIQHEPEHQGAYFKRGLMAFILDEADSEVYFKKANELDPEMYQEQLKQLKEIESFIQAQSKK